MDSSLRELYQDVILDHHRAPRNRREMPEASAKASGHNPLCGDRVSVFVKMDGDVLQDVSFVGTGCAISQASASMLTEMVEGQDIQAVRALTKEDLLEEIGIPISPARLKCALLPLKVLKATAYGYHGWPGEEDES
jgi:nitrogen fixation NifU-like protein